MSFLVVVVINQDVDDDEGVAVFLTDYMAAGIRILKRVDGVTQRFVDVNRIVVATLFCQISRRRCAAVYALS